MTVTDKDRGWQAILREATSVGEMAVSVGVHADARDHDGTTTAAIGAFHEYGIGVPQRAWLGPGIDDATPEILRLAERIYFDAILAGSVSARQAGGLIGERMQAAAQQRLRDKDPSWAPLAPYTKARKAKKIRGSKREGKGARQRQAEFVAGDGNPLIDTGQLLQSVRYKVHFGLEAGALH